MDKQKKRHISRKKFERVKRISVISNYWVNKNGDKYYRIYVLNDFMYWKSTVLSLDGTTKTNYYRKSLKEVFK